MCYDRHRKETGCMFHTRPLHLDLRPPERRARPCRDCPAHTPQAAETLRPQEDPGETRWHALHQGPTRRGHKPPGAPAIGKVTWPLARRTNRLWAPSWSGSAGPCVLPQDHNADSVKEAGQGSARAPTQVADLALGHQDGPVRRPSGVFAHAHSPRERNTNENTKRLHSGISPEMDRNSRRY